MSSVVIVKWFAFLNKRPQRGRGGHRGNEVGTLQRDRNIASYILGLTDQKITPLDSEELQGLRSNSCLCASTKLKFSPEGRG